MGKGGFITQSLIKNILDYDSFSGTFTWKIRPASMFPNERLCSVWNSNFAGKIAGGKTAQGYLSISILNKAEVLAHRLAWLYVYGDWPLPYVDHINGDRTDNRIENLREASANQNAYNAKLRSDNKSGYRGVFWNKQKQKWHAKMNIDGKTRHFGFFNNLNEAAAKACAVRKEFFGDFYRVA